MAHQAQTPILPVPREKQTGEYWKALNMVIDPELDVGIVDLGLVYDVVVKNGVATVIMTLTSMGCPEGPEIMRSIEAQLSRCAGIHDVVVNLVWDPVWGPDRVHEAIRDLLFGIE